MAINHTLIDSLGYIFVADDVSNFNQGDVFDSAEFGEITQNNSRYAVQGHSRPSGKLYAISYL